MEQKSLNSTVEIIGIPSSPDESCKEIELSIVNKLNNINCIM